MRALLLCALWLVLATSASALFPVGSEDGDTCEEVDAFSARNVNPEGKWRIFNQLTLDETREVLDFLVEEAGFFHVRDEAGLPFRGRLPTSRGPSVVQRVELFEPDKTEALAFLDGDGPVPQRFAKATVIRSESTPKDVMEYKVGPLPLEVGVLKPRSEIGQGGDDSPREGVIMTKLREDGEIPFIKRPVEPFTGSWSDALVTPDAYKLRQIFKESTGWCYGVDFSSREAIEESTRECGRDLIRWLSFPALDPDPSKRIMQVAFFFRTRNGGADEANLHPLPISYKIDETNEDERLWFTFDFEYCHQGPFSTADDLLAAYLDGQLVKCVADDWMDFNYDEGWSRTNNRDSVRNGAEKPGPRTFYPDGPRFTANVESRLSGGGVHFEYLGWEGHVSIRYGTGMAFHDIRFRGERIVYEMALQDQFVAYSGYSGNGQTIYMDSYYGIGLNCSPLRKGRDCPETAQYFPANKMYLSGFLETTPDVICIFEEDSQTPEWRHTHGNGTDGAPHIDSVRRSSLVVRTVATVGNYDYLYSIRFRPDGSMQVETTLAGYMLASFYDVNGQTSKDIPFGTRVHKHTFATLHDHLSSWKVDLDVLGTTNSIRKKSVKIGSWEEALANAGQSGERPPWHYSPVLKYIQNEVLDQEFGYTIGDPGTAVHAFTNEDLTNTWGQPRGYAIIHGMTTRQLLPDSHPYTKAASWSKYHLAVTRRKEDEACSNGAIYDMVSPGDPVTSLDDYIDGERISQKDLVAWVMVGLLHIPRSEDVPLVSNFETSFYLKPWNYFDELVSTDFGTTEDFDGCFPRVGNDFSYRWAYDF